MTTGNANTKNEYSLPSTNDLCGSKTWNIFQELSKINYKSAPKAEYGEIHDTQKVQWTNTAFSLQTLQILYALNQDDYVKRFKIATDMLHRVETDQLYLNRIFLSDKSTFHVFGAVNKYNVRHWGSEQPHNVPEIERNSENVNVWYWQLHYCIIGVIFPRNRLLRKFST